MIVGTIINRKYVEQRDRKLYAMELGLQVNKLLTGSFPIFSTSSSPPGWREELDTIASGKRIP